MILPVLAKEDVLERVDGDLEFLSELTEGFIASFPTQFAELVSAAEKSDASQTASRAHAIKGALRNLGGLKSGESAYNIEIAAKNGDLSESQRMLNELEANVKEFESAFRGLLASFK